MVIELASFHLRTFLRDLHRSLNALSSWLRRMMMRLAELLLRRLTTRIESSAALPCRLLVGAVVAVGV